VIENARVLRDDFVPGDVVQRSAELDTISEERIGVLKKQPS
jgi:hypothetical protein